MLAFIFDRIKGSREERMQAIYSFPSVPSRKQPPIKILEPKEEYPRDSGSGLERQSLSPFDCTCPDMRRANLRHPSFRRPSLRLIGRVPALS